MPSGAVGAHQRFAAEVGTLRAKNFPYPNTLDPSLLQIAAHYGTKMQLHLGDRLGNGMEKKLSAAKIKSIGDGKHQDGGGLIFHKSGLAGGWVFRFMLRCRRREIGLGSWPAVSLADARSARDKARAQAKQGMYPIKARNREQEAARAALERLEPHIPRRRACGV